MSGKKAPSKFPPIKSSILKSNDQQAVIWVVVATGISSVVTQLVIIREFLAQFHGNEVVIALILFNWLTLGGVGTFLSKLSSGRKFAATIGGLGWISLALPLLALIQILAIRFLRDALFAHGVSVGLHAIVAFSLATMGPYALIIGFSLPYSLFVIRRRAADYPGNRIYLADNCGDVAGGVLFSFVLVIWTTPMQTLLLAGIPLIFGAVDLFRRTGKAFLGAFLGVGVLFVLLSGALWETTLLPQFSGTLVRYLETRYGRIEVVAEKGQYTLFSDGNPITFTENRVAAEEGAHFALAQLDHPKHILMLSAAGGMLQEVIKHHPQRIDYLELDPQVARAALDFGLLEKVPGLHLIHQDGRRHLSRTKRFYDAILISLPDPETYQANRFFTEGFFALAKARLVLGGILSFSVEGFDNYMNALQRKKLSILYNTAAKHFAHVVPLPGQRIVFLCRDLPIQKKIPMLLAAKGIATDYIRSYFDGDLSVQRIAYLEDLIDSGAALNRDRDPMLMRVIFKQWFEKYAASPLWFLAVLSALVFFYLLRVTKGEFVLFTTGFAAMGAEVMVIFAFQIFFGYVYMQIGLIVTVFLAGLLPGALLGGHMQKKGPESAKIALLSGDAILALLVGGGLTALIAFGDRLRPEVFLVLGFGISFMTGFQFPLVLVHKGDDNRAATQSFSADLIGAALGTLITSLVLIPFLGLGVTAAVLLGLKALSLVVTHRLIKR
jgi:spermidine synthase